MDFFFRLRKDFYCESMCDKIYASSDRNSGLLMKKAIVTQVDSREIIKQLVNQQRDMGWGMI